MNSARAASSTGLVLAAAAMLLLTFGVRQTTGLFVAPIHLDTGVGIATISLALAIGQFVWGAVQPVFGAIADRHGAEPVLVAGGLLLAAGLALAPFLPSGPGLMLTLGVLTAAGAGGSLGQFVFAPLLQLAIGAAGWTVAMLGMAATSLLTLPLARVFRRHPGEAVIVHETEFEDRGLRHQLRVAVRDRSYWLLHLGFFTCGVHIAFLVTHLPGEIALCGLPASVSAASIALIGLFNVAGSLAAGKLGERFRMKWILAAMYASRALLIVLYLLAPPSALTFYLFAAGLGLSWLATVPPTAGLVGKLFGPRYLGTLFGLTLLTHQIGGFFGAWLGGVALEHSGSYQWMWYADIVLALLAAAANLPIRERALEPVAA